MIFLGDQVRDTVTGYAGIATARTEQIGGLTEWRIERANCDTGQPEDAWFPESRVELVEQPSTTPLGFVSPACQQREPSP